MLRKTVGRGFGGAGAPLGEELPPPPQETRRHAAMSRLFGELHRLLSEGSPARGSAPRNPAPEGPAADDAAAAAPAEAASPLATVTRPRSFSRGVEFRLTGPAGALSFLNDLRGLVRVSRLSGFAGSPGEGAGIPAGGAGTAGTETADAAEFEVFEVISLHPRARGYQPIRKSLPAGTRWPPADGRRTPFSFTTLRALAARYRALAGIVG